ncbi:PPOX class F420-dependent oxidoreductase [Actinomycetospora termitidis]|uniref:PPOX class F420-dependent oxidoreductase n=1 Tax=Actinomycetospora termitidis TaxID=3053470 RepID=A0ABT7MBB2_9PSEU|nr:PPOX class F420-dependent oxidoreductase [Actinomycetospora sp. Odt1-22]MDL5157958.1 PPOX class F420-dependent oxidoreductase [Actinomycetospora sp. Odt1-22]
MDLDEARAFLREHHRAVLATTRSDGAPQLSPVVVGIDDEGAAVISTRETAIKAKNLRRTPRAWVCVVPDGFFGQWAQVEGDVEIVDLPAAHEPLRMLYRQVSGGEHDDWDEFDEAMRRERRVAVRIHLDRAGPTVSG